MASDVKLETYGEMFTYCGTWNYVAFLLTLGEVEKRNVKRLKLEWLCTHLYVGLLVSNRQATNYTLYFVSDIFVSPHSSIGIFFLFSLPSCNSILTNIRVQWTNKFCGKGLKSIHDESVQSIGICSSLQSIFDISHLLDCWYWKYSLSFQIHHHLNVSQVVSHIL